MSAGSDDAPRRANSSEEMEVVIDSLAYRGWGVGRFSGKVVFVPFTAPGDLALVRPVVDHGSYVKAELLRVLEPSPLRTRPECPLFGVCGGCQWQHVNYAAQLEAKRRIVADCLQRIGGPQLGDAEVGQTVPSPLPYGYRDRVRLHVDREGRLGFYRRGSRSLVEVKRCPLLDDRLNSALAALRPRRGEREIDLRLGEDGKVRKGTGMPFGQVNPQVNARLRETLRQAVAAALADRAPLRVLDLYCGDGNLSLALAGLAERIVGYDADPAAVQAAVARARALAFAAGAEGPRGGPLSAEFRCEAVSQPLMERLVGEHFDVLILDPPRSGIRGLTERAAALAVPLIAYVSCSPPSLARDLADLVSAGYKLRLVEAFDMFPQTYHVETLAVLEHAASGPTSRRP